MVVDRVDVGVAFTGSPCISGYRCGIGWVGGTRASKGSVHAATIPPLRGHAI
jgi:hypothetical protein